MGFPSEAFLFYLDNTFRYFTLVKVMRLFLPVAS